MKHHFQVVTQGGKSTFSADRYRIDKGGVLTLLKQLPKDPRSSYPFPQYDVIIAFSPGYWQSIQLAPEGT